MITKNKFLIIIISMSFVVLGCKKNASQTKNLNGITTKSKAVLSGNTIQGPQSVDTLLGNPNSLDFKLTKCKSWIFDYRDASFPCDTNGGCMIKGFTIEADSAFYILGGNPAAISLFYGSNLIARTELNLNLEASHEALLHIHGDKVYLINEQNKTIYSLDKNLRFSATAFSLPLESMDSIVSGHMEKDLIILTTIKKDSVGRDDKNYTTWIFSYPNIIKRRFAESRDLYAHMSGYCKINQDHKSFFYQGMIDNYRIFLTPPEYDNCSIIVANEGGDCIYTGSFDGLPPIAAASGAEEHYGWLQSENLRVIHNNNIYMTGYDENSHKFFILEYGLFGK
ncbi:MAG: hypothetical protein IKR98_01435 [Bacteroidaceae bacterium]|nr:hypothetical protein [Bacteroidaceae bacterium]